MEVTANLPESVKEGRTVGTLTLLHLDGQRNREAGRPLHPRPAIFTKANPRLSSTCKDKSAALLAPDQSQDVALLVMGGWTETA